MEQGSLLRAIQQIIDINSGSVAYIMEPLLKGKAQYHWPPFTNRLRSDNFDNANIIHFLHNKLP
jgi:hypothetical protein